MFIIYSFTFQVQTFVQMSICQLLSYVYFLLSLIRSNVYWEIVLNSINIYLKLKKNDHVHRSSFQCINYLISLRDWGCFLLLTEWRGLNTEKKLIKCRLCFSHCLFRLLLYTWLKIIFNCWEKRSQFMFCHVHDFQKNLYKTTW